SRNFSREQLTRTQEPILGKSGYAEYPTRSAHAAREFVGKLRNTKRSTGQCLQARFGVGSRRRPTLLWHSCSRSPNSARGSLRGVARTSTGHLEAVEKASDAALLASHGERPAMPGPSSLGRLGKPPPPASWRPASH